MRGADTDGVHVEEIATPGGRPGRALLEILHDDDVLAVGARGRADFRALRLGSIAERLVRHAPGSVMVVRAPQ